MRDNFYDHQAKIKKSIQFEVCVQMAHDTFYKLREETVESVSESTDKRNSEVDGRSVFFMTKALRC